MKISYSSHFTNSFKKLRKTDQVAFETQVKKFLANPKPPFHPSLRIKKVQGTKSIFEMTISMGVRLTWEFKDDGILLRNIGEHDKTLKKP
jgi:mRNA-degrading endonuclease YafQ of YafQ-DinJ toxin-antitoxin module